MGNDPPVVALPPAAPRADHDAPSSGADDAPDTSSAPPNKQQPIATWIFGGFLLVFFVFLAYHPPKINQPIQYAAVTLLAGIFAGLFGFFITGTTVTTTKWQVTDKLTIDLRATGGFGFAMVAIFLFLFLNPYRSLQTAASDLAKAKDASQVSLNAPGKQVASAATIQVTPEIQAQAAQLAAAEPKFRALKLVAEKSVVPTGTFTEAINEIRTQTGQPGANTAALQRDFGSGVGQFRLGMTVDQVNALLPAGTPKATWDTLQHAKEYAPADVRYNWTFLQHFAADNPDPLSGALSFTNACWKGQSYAVFLFADQKLVRISVRFTNDCSQRNQFMQQIANTYSIQGFRPAGPLGFLVKLDSSTVASYIGNDGSIFEVSTNTAPTHTP